MASPDPIAAERAHYLSLLGLTVDDPAVTLSQLRSMTGAGVDARNAAEAARIVTLEGYLSPTELLNTIRARKSIRDFLKPVQIDSDAATLAQVDDPTSFIASPGSVVWDNYAAIGYPAGNPVPVTPGTPYNPGARFQPTGGDNVQSLPFSFYANGKIGIHVTLWADTDIWVSIDGKPISADPFIIKVADTATSQPFVTIDTGNPDAPFVRYDITLGWGANLIQIINEPGALMTAGEAPTFRLGLTGDSYADSGIGPYYGGPAQTLRQLTGVNVIPLGQGSTGYTNDGSSSGDLTKEVFGGTNRLAAIAGAELDALIVVGSINDGGSTPAATKAAALAFYAAVSPLPVIVVGVEPLYDAADPTYAGWDALNDALIEAADEAPNVIGFVDWRGEDWLTGTGSQSNIQYDGNQDWAIGDVAGTDTIHPSHAGWKLLLIPRLIEAIAPMKIAAGGGGGVTVHGALTGLANDDHPQYQTQARSDARYSQLGHTHQASQISDSTAIGRQVLQSADATTIRGLIGAGTGNSNLTLGTTAGTAKPGDYAPTWNDVSGKPTSFNPVLHAATHSKSSSDPIAVTDLAVGTLADGQMLVRSGANLVGQPIPSGGGGGGGGSGLSGTGSPEGVVTATPGTEYIDTAATNGAVKWIKATGSGNTGWKVAYGDTGWRNMQAQFESICTANSLTFSVAPGYSSPKIKRVGDFLILDVGVNITGNLGDIDFRSALGQNLNGFRGGPSNRQIPASVTGSAGVIHWAPGIYIRFWSPGLQTLNVVWPITDTAPWPTSLPGVPA